MALAQWSLVACLCGLFLLGLPNGVKLEASVEETKTSSVKDCKVHIEKALEQYWEHKAPDQKSDSTDQTQNINPVSTNDDGDDDDDDDEDDNNNISEKVLEGNESSIENQDEENDEDDEDDEDDEGENDEDEKANESEGTPAEDTAVNEDDEDEDEDEDEDDSEETQSSSSDSSSDAVKVQVDDEKVDQETNVRTDKEEELDEDDDDEDDQDTDDDDLADNEDTAESEEGQEEGKGADQAVEDDEENEEDEEQAEEALEDEEDDEEEEEQPSAETALDTDKKVETETSAADEETESDKVTGEADRASAGVVPELSEEQPSLEQPETPPVPEETFSVTPAAQEQDEVEEDDEEADQETEPVQEETDDLTIENIYEEADDDDESSSTVTFRSRDHIDVILGLDEIGTEYDKEEEKLAQSIFKEIKKIELTSIKPMEMLYKYTDSTTRVLGDAEIFNQQMLLFLGPWNSGKTTIINYLLGTERTPLALKTGTGITDVDFTLITYGDQKQVVSGTELAVDWRYAGVQKFGQGFLDHFRNIQIPSTLLKKVTIVDTPGILENKKNTKRGYSFNDAIQWFIDRADAIYVVLDPTKVDIGSELGSVFDQLKGRDVRFILNKADSIRRSDLMRVVGQLFWNLSPLMSGTEAPIIYAVSLTTQPYHPSAPARFLADQENNFLHDLKETLDKRVENRILYARRHAVRVRNHAKMVDCYLATYYRHKSIFSNKKNVAKLITENPRDYNIFEGIGSFTNISRYDLPDPVAYKQFFSLHPLYDFKPLASTCSYFRGCPMEKLDAAIAQEIPELFAKYKKAKSTTETAKQEGR